MISESTKSTTRPIEGGVKVSGSSRAGRDESKLDKNKIDGREVNDEEIGDNEIGKNVQKLSKSKSLSKSK